MHRGMDIILDIPENDLIALGGQHKLLLVSVGSITGDLLEGLGDDRIVGCYGLGIGKLVFRTLLQILDGVFHFRFLHIHEGEFVL